MKQISNIMSEEILELDKINKITKTKYSPFLTSLEYGVDSISLFKQKQL